jgi:hypothetical protein
MKGFLYDPQFCVILFFHLALAPDFHPFFFFFLVFLAGLSASTNGELPDHMEPFSKITSVDPNIQGSGINDLESVAMVSWRLEMRL